MANESIIRHDVIQLDFISNIKELTKLNKEVDELKKKLGGVGGEGIENIKEKAEETQKPLKKLKENVGNVSKKLTDLGKKAATTAFNGLKKIAGISFKALTVGITGIAAAVGKIAYESVQAYGEFEQLKGGMEKIFDQANTKQIMKDANKAYLDLGMSANAYLRTINDTGANFASTMGDQKGYETARTGMLAISNYASGTGKSIDLLSEKFTMITRASSSYQSIADQFSGVLPATSKDFLAQAQAAGFLEKGYKKLTDVPIAEYQEAVAKMLEKGVSALGLTGNTAAEAEGTVTGSLGMMKATWDNLLVSFGTGERLDENFDIFISAVEAFGKQTIPIVEKSLTGISKVVEKLSPIIAEKLPTLAEELLPPLIKAAIELAKGLIKALPSIIKTVAETIVDVFGEQFPIIGKIGDFFKNNANSIATAIKKLIPVVIALVAAFKGFKMIKGITSLFGGSSTGGEGAGEKSGGLFGGLAQFAKISPKTVLKGMANLAIVIGGLVILAAAVMAISPYLAKLSDFQSLIEVISVITVLGVVGTALAKAAGTVGNIPVVTVLKGLANIAIIVAGMSALYLLIGAVSLINFNISRILYIAVVIGVLGTVGAAVTLFAGIAGLIPIPVVLAGLANIALVLGGITGIVVAFGALTKISGFTEFLTKGGEVLAQIFGIIGDMVGSLVGGALEAISNALPAIGENLAAFGTNLKPLFSCFEGVNMQGLGDFFLGLAGFLGALAADKIVSIFGGKTDFAGISTGLGDLAGEGTKKFLDMVKNIEEPAFTNAKLFFEALDGISSLPNAGGIGQYFSGKNDFSGVATGLGDLTGEGVKGFFTMVQGFEATAFDNAKLFFEALGNISKLPNAGGIGQWFSGENDFSGIAEGLKSLSSDGIKSFFTMVNELDIDKLNGLWDSLKNAGKLTADKLSIVIDESISTLVDKISKLPQKMGDALKNNSKGLSDGFVSMWKAAVEASVAPVNKLLDGANHILKEFGSDKKVIEWKPYARGTGGHKGGNALVNDGRGAELIQMPNGRTFIPNGRNVFIPNAPKGMKVLPASQTARLMGKHSPTFRYAEGIGDIDIWSYFDNASGLISKLTSGISYDGMSGFARNLGQGMVSTFSGAMTSWVKKLFEEEGGKSLASYVASKGVGQWRSTVIRALKMEGQYSAANVKRTLYQMQTESGGNPYAINLWDSNAKKGIPSKGLMQVIDPTFRAYAREGFNKNIYDPLSNILASIRYATSRYGSLAKAYQGHGYANGVGAKSIELPQYTPSSSISNSSTTETNTYAPSFTLNISGTGDDRAMARKVKRWIAEAMEETFEGLSSKNRVIREV